MLKNIRVNLKSKEVSTFEFDMMKVKLGNRGLIAKTMTEEVNPRCNPLGSENKLIFATGIYAGYGFPTGNRLSVGAKSPLTGGIKESNVGGTMGTYFANHGIKELILEDTGDEWSILVIDEAGSVTLIYADEYVGKGTYEASEMLYEQYGKKISACIIGPAGERMNTAASIQILDNASGHPSRAAGRGGLGAVMGSKKIKAVVILAPKEKEKLPIVNEEKLKTARAALVQASMAGGAALKQGGTNVVLDALIPVNILPVQNFSGRLLNKEESDKVGTKAYIQRANSFGGKQGVACQPGCPIQCSNIINDKDGNMITAGLEYETYALGGPNCNIFDIDYIAYFDKACDDLGIDTIEAGNAIAVAMDAGFIPWGDIDKAKALINGAYKGTEAGLAFSNGVKSMGDYLNHDRVPQVKNQAFPAYDPRALKGMGVTYATSTMGADHTAGHTFSAKIDHTKPEGQVATSQQMQVVGCIADNVCCLFSAGAIFAPQSYEFAQAIFGDDINPTYLQSAGVQTIMMERAYNTKAGVEQKQDVLPEFLRNEKTQGTQTIFDVEQEEMNLMWVPEEYRTIHGFDIATKLFAGKGKLKVVADLLSKYKAKNVLLVYDKGVAHVGIVDKVKAFIDSEKYNIIEYDGVLADPPFHTIKEALEKIGDTKIDAAIAIGGGSSIDTTKAVIAALAYPDRSIDMLLAGTPYNDREVAPIIVIPTTAGTGSEVTTGGVISAPNGMKKTVQTKAPNAAIMDPTLTVGLPKSITVATGLDALTHCIGGYFTLKENQVADAFAEKGIRLVLENLPILMEDGSNLKARENMAVAATLGGLVINSALSMIDHSFAHVIGGKYHIAHGLCCAIALPYVVEFVAEAKPKKINNLCHIFGINTENMTLAEMGKSVKQFLIELNEKFEVPTLSSFNQTSVDDIDYLSMETVTEMLAMFSPKKLEFNDAKIIYEEIFSA